MSNSYQNFYDDNRNTEDEYTVEYGEVHSQKFEIPTKRHDWIFSLLFVIQLVTVTITAILFASKPYEVFDPSHGYFSLEQRTLVIQMVLVCCVISISLCVFWLGVMFVLVSHLIHITTFLFVVFSLICTIASFVVGLFGLGSIMILMNLFSIGYAATVRSRILFSSSVMKLAIGIIRMFPTTVFVTFGICFAQVLWINIWTFLVISVLSQGNVVTGTAVFLLSISLYWTSQVLKNLVHFTVSGTVSMWYFLHETGIPANPTFDSFKIAIGHCFGSICFGSLLGTVLRYWRTILTSLRRSSNRYIVMIASLLTACLDKTLNFVNIFTLTHVSIYRKSYVQSGGDAWTLMRTRGIDVLLNSELVLSALNILCIVNGCFTGLCGGLWASQHEDMSIVVVSELCFNVGFTLTILITEILESGIVSLLLSYAEDPNILSRADPVMFARIREACCIGTDI